MSHSFIRRVQMVCLEYLSYIYDLSRVCLKCWLVKTDQSSVDERNEDIDLGVVIFFRKRSVLNFCDLAFDLFKSKLVCWKEAVDAL